jgi:Na+/H+ antiporter NhaD/arsenite permease-like protein
VSLAWLSVAALILALVLSCTTRLNIGVVSLVFAWVVGVYLGGMKFEQVAAGFPVQLFLTLTGVTLLFTQAQTNGTLDKVARRAVALCRGNAGMVPMMFFVLAAALASMGPGNIATAALLAPMAMSVAVRAGISPFLMAIMVGNGANAGSLSPFAPTGVIVNELMTRIGAGAHEWLTYRNNLLAHAAVAFGGYFVLGGWRLFGARYQHSDARAPATEPDQPLAAANWITLAVIATLILSVIFLKINIGMGAFTGSVILLLLRAADHAEAMRKIPWNVIVMVCGVTVLIALLERTQGIELFTALLARIATRESVTAAVAFITGLVSVYSSTSGVVLPAFLPTVPGLAAHLGVSDPFAIASSMNVGGHLVDVSPLSTIGALCLASVAPGAETRDLFNKLLAWGISMTVVGAATCWVLFGRG